MGKNITEPPKNLSFWKMFDFFWDNGIGNDLDSEGAPVPWTAQQLEDALEGTPDKRTIENWQRHANLPSRENLRKLAGLASGGDRGLRNRWHEALFEVSRAERELKKEEKTQRTDDTSPDMSAALHHEEPSKARSKALILGLAGLIALAGAGGVYYSQKDQSVPLVENMRICDRFFFDFEAKKCKQHMPVFMSGIDEVYLSFDFNNVPEGTPFERWWIRNGERIAGRTSFNDDAWPGYTFWRPGGPLPVGQYVVRLVVEGQVETQAFLVQQEGVISEP